MAETFNTFLVVMALVALVVFIALYFVEAGYGMLFNKKWGLSIPNRWGWMLMEAPVFIAMAALWYFSDRRTEPVCLCFFLLFQLHYLQRAFIFPFLIKGNSRMPLGIISMGIFFNILKALMQGGWIFYISSPERYPVSWFHSPQFIIGTILFFCGMFINIHSDKIIRDLRKPGDKRHYIPRGGMFRYVSSANYFGEILEWTGFAVLTWSWAGAVFAWWTFANLTPRSAALYRRYKNEFGNEFTKEKRKRIIPFIY